MQQLFEKLASFKARKLKPHHRAQLGETTCSDILWWVTFIRSWNGISFMPHGSDNAYHLWSDASGSFGCGAVYPNGSSFHGLFRACQGYMSLI